MWASGLTHITANTIAAWFLRVILWLNRKNGLLCRECGMAVPPEDGARFVSEGCLSCGGKKLRII